MPLSSTKITEKGHCRPPYQGQVADRGQNLNCVEFIIILGRQQPDSVKKSLKVSVHTFHDFRSAKWYARKG